MKSFKELSQNEAKTVFNNGQSVYVIPCLQNVNVLNIEINKNGLFQDFETYCNFISYYNCNETLGKSLKFYI